MRRIPPNDGTSAFYTALKSSGSAPTTLLTYYFLSKRTEICLLRVEKKQLLLKTLNLGVGESSVLMHVEKCYTVCQSSWQSTAMVPGRTCDGADD